jgi:hypothetical protein
VRRGRGLDRGAKRGLTGGPCYNSGWRGQRDSKRIKMIQIILNNFKIIQTSFDLKRTFLSSKNLK